jgi:glycerate 2-kinase
VTSQVPIRQPVVPHKTVLPDEVNQRATEIAAASPGLISGPCSDLRRATLQVAAAGLLAADPAAATRREVGYNRDTDTLRVGSVEYRLSSAARVWVIGAGKASYRVAAALEEILGDRVEGGVVAVRDPDVSPLRYVQVIHSDHPLPSSRSVEAATRILATARAAGADDIVLATFTGGSSALASLPPPGVSGEDKRILHELLLSSGLAITEINAVRKSVSGIKGGRVAVAAMPATVVNLTVSDVAGSPLDAVTDPTVQDGGSAAHARSILRRGGLWERVPASVRAHLDADLATPVLGREPQTVMLADGASTVAVMDDAAQALGFRAVSIEEEVEGESDLVGALLADRLIEELARTVDQPVMLFGCGGESVVTVTSAEAFSLGGPNQHAALRASGALRGVRGTALFIDTDGSDGGTEFAGALVDGATADLAESRGVDIGSSLAEQRSSEACKALDAAVRTGHTGTNVNDLFVLVAESGVL